MPPATPRTPDLASSLSARQDLAFTWKGRDLLTGDLARLLQAIHRTGTIRQGGLAVGWSYRTCLNRLRRMGDCLGAPVVETARGGRQKGGARLTPSGIQLVRLYLRLSKRLDRRGAAELRNLMTGRRPD